MRILALIGSVSMLLAGSVSAVDYALPFEGRWFVGQAGDTPNVNHHVKMRAQRYGVDFLKVGGLDGRLLAKTTGKDAEDYFSWDQPVLAPADGVVRLLVSDKPDNKPGIKDLENPFGNYLVIQTAPAEFVFLAHLKKGSLLVGKGDRVKKGQLLARCGNSGNSDAPHIHMHVQDTLIFSKGTGVSVTFSGIDVELSGKKFRDVDWPLIRGLFVSNSQP